MCAYSGWECGVRENEGIQSDDIPVILELYVSRFNSDQIGFIGISDDQGYPDFPFKAV